jgi:hypothetical protein
MGVSISGDGASEDLGNSSKYSNELQCNSTGNSTGKIVREALKIVVGKVFLRVALMQELVGPKRKGNTVNRAKGTQVNIPELETGGIAAKLCSLVRGELRPRGDFFSL